jgi:hypothetical protein
VVVRRGQPMGIEQLDPHRLARTETNIALIDGMPARMQKETRFDTRKCTKRSRFLPGLSLESF